MKTSPQYVDYKDKIVVKPWGYEFLIYMNKKVGIWFLKIDKGQKTSMHTHFCKDTLLICYKGLGLVGLVDENIILHELEQIFIPRGKFHELGSLSFETYYIEIEVYDNDFVSFSDKNDLLRIKDLYDRETTGYEKSINLSTDLSAYHHFYLDHQFSLKYLNNQMKCQVLQNSIELDPKHLNILLEGEVYIQGNILKEGSILLSDQLQHAKCIKNITVFSIYSPFKEENKKIIYDTFQLQHIINSHSQKEKKNILTSGCFDILHCGHLNTLQQAKNLGDSLFVCLSNDEQIKKLKGDDRPINCYQDRIDFLKTIPYIDYIILYDEEDIEKESTLDKIMHVVDPFAWVKGSDYTVEKIKEKHPDLKNIVLLDYVENKSTTNIIKKIKK